MTEDVVEVGRFVPKNADFEILGFNEKSSFRLAKSTFPLLVKLPNNHLRNQSLLYLHPELLSL